MTNLPNTTAPAKDAIALEVQTRLDSEQRWSFELGGPVTLQAKRVPVQVIDFYQEAETA